MGAAVTLELQKPIDASDILNTGDLTFAKNEVIRLRTSLGHLAKEYGIEILDFSANDICLGQSSQEDFERCVKEVAHIRACLQLNTQQSKRRMRGGYQSNNNIDNLAESNDYQSSSESD